MKALITGITGQDGSYLSELLLEKGYEVYGAERRVAIEDQRERNGRISHLLSRINLFPCDITNYPSVFQLISEVNPDELYHLAAQSFVAESFVDEFQTFDTNITGTLNVLNSLRKINSGCRFYFAGSSEMFGEVKEEPQLERTPFHPKSPYGISKVAGFDLTRNYREAYKMFCCSGILFNHESPRRGIEFVTRKITNSIARIKSGLQRKLMLGNLDAKRDWGFSGDYIRAMWLMLQQNTPNDFVIATGETYTVREFLEEAARVARLNIHSNREKGVSEKYLDKKGTVVVEIDPQFYRPADINTLTGDYSKARKILGWEPKVKFHELVKMMVEEDIKRLK